MMKGVLLFCLHVQRKMELLDTIRREARRYTKSEAIFKEPTSIDLLMIHAAQVNLLDLEVSSIITAEFLAQRNSTPLVCCARGGCISANCDEYWVLHSDHSCRLGDASILFRVYQDPMSCVFSQCSI